MITSAKNRWLKDMRRLRTSKGRRSSRETGLLLLEGPHLLREAVNAEIEIEVVLATPEFLAGQLSLSLTPLLPRPPLQVESALLDQIADADSPRGIVGLGIRHWTRLADLPSHSSGFYVYADGLQDPGNVGALARVAEASGAHALILGRNTVSPAHSRALRASAGSLLRLPIVENAMADDVAERLGSTWVKLQTRDGEPLYSNNEKGANANVAAANSSRILAVGAEGRGLSPEVEALAGLSLTIPLAGEVESLNATVAAAIVLFEWRRQTLGDYLGTKRT